VKKNSVLVLQEGERHAVGVCSSTNQEAPMPSLHTLMTFALVSLGVSLIPGPSTFFLLSQGALHGRARALASVAGIEIASAIRVLATAAGLSALLASSAAAFSTIRWVGVAYLAYLGLRAMTAGRNGHPKGLGEPQTSSPNAATAAKAIRKGVLVGLGNVKMAIFYLAFFPQFVHPDRGSQVAQILILGTVFWVIGLSGDLLYALASATVGRWIRARPRINAVQARTEAVSYLALAGWTATSG
jgi:threonine/homoserine/homoserine lactone efflux protein